MKPEEPKQKSFEELSAEISHDFGVTNKDPIEPDTRYKYKTAGKAWKFYQSIPWPEWWNEFNSAQTKNGRRKYGTIRSFISQKTKITWQRKLLWQMIGGQPELNSSELEVPCLGDWEKRRRNGFYIFDDKLKARAVQRALDIRQSLEGAVQALAPLIARRMAFWYKIRDQITDAYAGEIVGDGKVTGPEQQKRLATFFQWQQLAEDIITKLEEQWMKIHRVNPEDAAQQWVTAAALGGRIGAAAALTGVAATGQIPGRPTLIQDGVELPLPENVTYDSMLLADHLRGHAETFNLPLPEDMKQAKRHGKPQ